MQFKRNLSICTKWASKLKVPFELKCYCSKFILTSAFIFLQHRFLFEHGKKAINTYIILFQSGAGQLLFQKCEGSQGQAPSSANMHEQWGRSAQLKKEQFYANVIIECFLLSYTTGTKLIMRSCWCAQMCKRSKCITSRKQPGKQPTR